MTTPGTDDAAGVGLDPDALQRLSDRIRGDVADGRYLAGAVLVARGGTVGYRDFIGEVAPGRPSAPDDIYLAMSLSKSFTAALVLRAVDHGRFSFDTRVADLIPGFGVRGKGRVTVRHLLTHTGGTYAGFAPPAPLTMAECGELERNVRAVSQIPLASTPGERVVYNPFASYAILGQILVESDPAGRSFRDIAREDLFDPLGMADTTYGCAVDEPRRVPVSVPSTEGAVTDSAVFLSLNQVFTEESEHPAGGAFGTIDDMFRFADVLRARGANRNHRLLSQAMVDYATRNHTGDRPNGFWDFDKQARDIPDFPANFSLLGGYVRGHGDHLSALGQLASPRAFGAVGGGSTLWMVDPDRDLTFVFMSAGFLEGLDHFRRLERLSDLALASVVD